MSKLEINRRRLLAGGAAVALVAILPPIPVSAAPIDIEAIAARINAAIDATPHAPMTRDEWWARRTYGGFEMSADVARYRNTGLRPWE